MLPHRHLVLPSRLLHRQQRLSTHLRSFASFTPLAEKQSKPENTPTPPSPTRPPPRRTSPSSQLPILPLIAIFCLGSGSFYFLAKSREGITHQTYTAGEKAPPKDQWPGRRRDTEQ